MKIKTYMSVRTQFSNLGDLIINKVLLILLQDMSDEVYIDIAGVPDWYLKNLMAGLDHRKFKKVNGLALYYAIAKLSFKDGSNVLVLKPGGYMASKSLKVNVTRLLQGFILAVVRLFGNKVVRAPSSQQISRGVYKYIDQFRLRMVSTTFARDAESSKNLSNLKCKTVQAPDLADFLTHEKYYSTVLGIARNDNGSREKIVFSFRERIELNEVEFNSQELSKYEPFYVSQVFGDEMHVDYLNFSLPVTTYDGSDSSIKEIIRLYTESKYVISNRLHVLMLALVSGAIPIAVCTSDDRKVSAYMKSIGLGANVLDVDNDTTLDEVLSRGVNVDTSMLVNDLRDRVVLFERDFYREIYSGAR